MTQAQLARLTPQGGYIWTDHHHGGFQAKFKPFPRIARKWHLHGGARAAGIVCLRYLWEKWCLVEGMPQSRVPIKDLWTCSLGAGEPLPARTEAASSSGV